jgi:hypothetical protein
MDVRIIQLQAGVPRKWRAVSSHYSPTWAASAGWVTSRWLVVVMVLSYLVTTQATSMS